MRPRLSFVILVFCAAAAVSFSVAAAKAEPLSSGEMQRLANSSDLRLGMRGSGVSLLQKFLSAETDLNPSIYPARLVTGYFGNLTRQALRRWQSSQNLLVTGIFDRWSRQTIAKRVNGPGGTPVVASTTLPEIPAGSIQIGDNPNYRQDLVEATAFPRFSNQDLDLMRNTYGSMQPVPEIIRTLSGHARDNNAAAAKKDLAALAAWDNYFVRMTATFQRVKVPPAEYAGHSAFLRWLKYNRQVIAKITPAASAADLAAIYSDYRNVYFANQADIVKNLRFGAPLAARPRPSLSAGLKEFFLSLLPHRASAEISSSTAPTATSTATSTVPGEGSPDDSSYQDLLKSFLKEMGVDILLSIILQPFGGTVVISDVCTTGELVTVKGKNGGQFFLYWGVLAFNPFPFNNVTDGNWILGEAVRYPGVCNKGLATYPSGQGFIIFFGTSKSPAT